MGSAQSSVSRARALAYPRRATLCLDAFIVRWLARNPCDGWPEAVRWLARTPQAVGRCIRWSHAPWEAGRAELLPPRATDRAPSALRRLLRPCFAALEAPVPFSLPLPETGWKLGAGTDGVTDKTSWVEVRIPSSRPRAQQSKSSGAAQLPIRAHRTRCKHVLLAGALPQPPPGGWLCTCAAVRPELPGAYMAKFNAWFDCFNRWSADAGDPPGTLPACPCILWGVAHR